jgi:hypothetical protein
MASPTLHFRQPFAVRQFFAFEVRVAGNAGEGRMDRLAKFLLVDKNRERLSLFRAGQGFVAVAAEAISVLLAHRRCKPQNRTEDHSKHPKALACSVPGSDLRYVDDLSHWATSLPLPLSDFVVRLLPSTLFSFHYALSLRARADALLPFLLP